MTTFSRNVPLGLCLLLLFHGCLAQVTPLGKQPQSPRLRGQSECEIDRITAREPNRVLVSEAGVSEFWDSFENDELECAGVEAVRHTINPKGLLLPYYPSAPELVYVVRGRGLQGTVIPGCPETFETSFASEGGREQFFDKHQRVYRYNEGDILALPAGTVHWTYNDGETPIVAIVLRDISNVANQLDSNFRKFFLAGNPESQQVSQGGQSGRRPSWQGRGHQGSQQGRPSWQQPGQHEQSRSQQGRTSWQQPGQHEQSRSQQGRPSWQQPGQHEQSRSQQGRPSWQKPGQHEESRSQQGRPSWQQPAQRDPSWQQPGKQGHSSQESWESTTRPSGRREEQRPWESSSRPSRRSEEQQPWREEQQGQEGYNIFSGFDDRILEEIFKVESDTIRKLQGAKDNRGLIVNAENFQVLVPEEQEQQRSSHGRGRSDSGRTNGIEQTLCSTQMSSNIANPARADVYNPRGGRISSLNSHKLPVLNSLQLSAERGVLYKNAVLAPHYNLNAHSIVYVTSGSSRLQIVKNNGKTVFDDVVREGQLIVVPQDFAVIKKAGEEGCEWVAFKTNDNAITTQLAGRFSFIRALPEDVLVNSYDISREQAKSLKYNRQEGVVLSPRSESATKKATNALLSALFG